MTDTPSFQRDRRSNRRQALRTGAVVVLPDGRQIEVRTLDISSGGIGIVSDVNPRPGSLFVLSLTLALRPNGHVRFEARSRVANCVFDGAERGFRIGLQFLALEEEARKVLDRVLA